MRSKKEIARLVRVARAAGHFAVGDRWELWCPVHAEALRKVGDRGLAHRFGVYHLPWVHKMTAEMVGEALKAHLADAEINEEPCDDLARAAQR